jgi:hypothetical protein
MKISKQLEDVLNAAEEEVRDWPLWKRSLDQQNQKKLMPSNQESLRDAGILGKEHGRSPSVRAARA